MGEAGGGRREAGSGEAGGGEAGGVRREAGGGEGGRGGAGGGDVIVERRIDRESLGVIQFLAAVWRRLLLDLRSC